MFLSCIPTVTVVCEDYEILVSTKENGVIGIEVGGVIYYEDNSGALPSEKNYAKVRLPQKVLDKAKLYTVVFRKSIERVAYWSKLGESERESFKFKPCKRRGDINIYHLADIHSEYDLALSAGKYFGSKLDLIILNGDYSELDVEEDYFKIRRFAGELSGGKIPVILTRGNHDTRGTVAEKYTDHLTSDGKKTYYTFKVGGISGIVLDCGEDKPDESIEYGGTNDFYGFRRRETEFLKSLKGGKFKPLLAIGHSCPAHNTTRPNSKFDIEGELYSEWNEEMKRLGIKFYLMGHLHVAELLKKNDEKSLRPHSYPIIVGSACILQSGDFCGAAMTISNNTLTVRFTNYKKEVKEVHKIDLTSGEILE